MFILFMEYKHISSTGIDMSHIYRGYINNGIILVVATVYVSISRLHFDFVSAHAWHEIEQQVKMQLYKMIV